MCVYIYMHMNIYIYAHEYIYIYMHKILLVPGDDLGVLKLPSFDILGCLAFDGLHHGSHIPGK